MSYLEIYDCTLREGEQAAGASFSLENRIKLFKLLDEFGVDYIELGWPHASKEILESFELCKKIRKNAKIVAFGSTSISRDVEKDENLNSIVKSKADYACIFGKTHKEHVEKQLKITSEENLERISNSIKFLKDNGMKVFYDAEHYFDGFKEDGTYAIETLIAAAKAGAEKIILCDTNGGMFPNEVEKIVAMTIKRLDENEINIDLGIHLHNDQGLALANTLISLPYITQVQGTINGIGERIGNLNFSEFLPIYINKMGNNLKINLKDLKKISDEAYRLSGVEAPESRAFVGETAFAHKGGVHIDATSKGASYEHANPEDFGNKRIILLNSLGGKSGVANVAENFGYSLDKKNPETKEKIEKLFRELIDLERRGYRIGTIPAEHYLLIEKYFGNLKEFFHVEKWKVETEKEGEREESEFFVRMKINENLIEERMRIDGGPIDAAYKTFSKLLAGKYPKIQNLKLKDFHVGIARSKAEESNVRTLITFEDDEIFQTVGVDTNIIQSTIEALIKGFDYYLNKLNGRK